MAGHFDANTAALCMAATLTGQDRELHPVQRAFLYMSLQHFEDDDYLSAGAPTFGQ